MNTKRYDYIDRVAWHSKKPDKMIFWVPDGDHFETDNPIVQSMILTALKMSGGIQVSWDGTGNPRPGKISELNILPPKQQDNLHVIGNIVAKDMIIGSDQRGSDHKIRK